MSMDDVSIDVTVVHSHPVSAAMSGASKSGGSTMKDVEEKIGDDENESTNGTASTIQSQDNADGDTEIDINKIYEGNKNFSMEVKLSDLKKRETLGQGAGGFVFLMIHKPTKKKMALKVGINFTKLDHPINC